VISARHSRRKSQQDQSVASEVTYHWQIGRETTAVDPDTLTDLETYHWQIGRETTAMPSGAGQGDATYHWQIGRETTA
tara:strand:- start:243 stop:476 length:234 start_codon:yes stop_codon:yes gene_type:complete